MSDRPTAVQEETETEEKQILRIALAAAPTQLDPASISTVEAFQAAFMIYDGLVWVDRNLRPQPMLAESWDSTADGLSWLFQLRQDAIFHHGTILTARDVVHTFERLIDPATGSRLAASLRFVDSVVAVDEHKVEFRLASPNMDLLLLLGAAQARIIAHDYSSALLNTQPSGTGPFKISEITVGRSIRFVRNEAYWDRERVDLQEVEHVYLPTLEEQAAALSIGEIELIPDIGSNYPDILADDPAVTILEAPSGAYQTVVMQATDAPFNDVRVRQALKHCIDRNALQARVLSGRGEIGRDQPVASISPFWADLPAPEPDLVQARRLLAEAGYPSGFEIDLLTSSSRPGMVDLAEAVREMAAPAGIKINVILAPADVYWTDYGGQTPFHIGNWNFRPSIDETFMLAYHSQSEGNEAKWSSPELDEWIDGARGEPDEEKRAALYAQAQAFIAEEGAVVVPYFRPVLAAVRTNIQGFQPHPAGWLDLRDVRVRATQSE